MLLGEMVVQCKAEMSGDSKSTLTTFENRIVSLGKTAASLYGLKKAFDFLMESSANAERKAEAFRALASTLHTVGLNFKELESPIRNYLNNIQDTTRYSEDRVLPALEQMIRATGDLKEAQKLVNIAMGIGSTGIMPMEEALNKLKMAYIGNQRGILLLQRDFKSLIGDEKDGIKIINTLAGEYGKSVFLDDTRTKKIEVLKNNWKEFREEIGRLVNVLTNPLIDMAVSSLEALRNAGSGKGAEKLESGIVGQMRLDVENWRKLSKEWDKELEEFNKTGKYIYRGQEVDKKTYENAKKANQDIFNANIKTNQKIIDIYDATHGKIKGLKQKEVIDDGKVTGNLKLQAKQREDALIKATEDAIEQQNIESGKFIAEEIKRDKYYKEQKEQALGDIFGFMSSGLSTALGEMDIQLWNFRDIFNKWAENIKKTLFDNIFNFLTTGLFSLLTGRSFANLGGGGMLGKLLFPAAPAPATAEGGIVTTPQIRMVGESGSEAIIPLKDINKVMNQAGVGRVNITIVDRRMSGSPYDKKQLSNEIGKILKAGGAKI